MTSSPLPVLPLRNIVVFPHMVVNLFVAREQSVRALEAAMAGDKSIVLVTQKDEETEDPQIDDLYKIGTLARVLQLLKLPDGTVKILTEGLERVVLEKIDDGGAYLEAEVAILADAAVQEEEEGDTAALMQTVFDSFREYSQLESKISSEVLKALSELDDPSRLADQIAAHLNLKIAVRQTMLELIQPTERLEQIFAHIEREISVMRVEKRLRGRVKKQMEKNQREYYLNEQMKAIQRELGQGEEGKSELNEIENKIARIRLSKEARSKAQAEFKKLRLMSPMSAEATVVRNYLDWVLALPWRKSSRLKQDLAAAEAVLEAEHYGLEKVKERILEYLAVQNRMKKMKGPILCLVGPPGVGKTSLGQSIAKATGRKFVRLSLGGVRDESEIRGHRRTYIGSMPGKIIQSMKKAGTSNPLILLDEIDKLGADWRGDPTSALLEVLDPAQNHSFGDHYLEVDYDLSNVLFMTTANSLNMPGPLIDRMEIIRLAGYTEEEKIEIARRHLIPRQLKAHGLAEEEIRIADSALRGLVRHYTREAGVRNLEREIANLARKSVKALDLDKHEAIEIDEAALKDYAGVKKFRYGLAEDADQVGVVSGLAWTGVGGDILTIEAVTSPGRGRVVATGSLGDVMKESIQAAESFVKARAHDLGIRSDIFAKRDIHVHVPEGATPKDGPSAGVAMVTSIVSVLTGLAVRKDVAMTGEVTLRGRVLPIGGLKEKLLAALRGGITTVLIPAENEKDLEEVPDNVKDGLTIIPVDQAEAALAQALVAPLTPLTAEERAAVEQVLAQQAAPPQAPPTLVAH
jgi:ATP-dependent Lon protease